MLDDMHSLPDLFSTGGGHHFWQYFHTPFMCCTHERIYIENSYVQFEENEDVNVVDLRHGYVDYTRHRKSTAKDPSR